jgi:Family of unknown function (DUF6311)
MAKRVVPWVGGTLGVLWFYLLFGPSVLDPTSLGWLTEGDAAQHLLGWLFFRHEPWMVPLGSLVRFGYPIGTTVGFTDGIPWVAVFAKTLSPLLPIDFQYFGLWSGLCFFLRGVVGVKIVQELSPRPVVQLLGGAFFIINPLQNTFALGSHWLILALIWLHIRPCPDRVTQRRILKMAVGLCCVSAGIHPYLAAMVLALSLALVGKLHWGDHLLSTRQLLGWGVACGASVIAVLALFGFVGTTPSLGAEGFGYHSADLLTLINPGGRSRFLPTLPTAPGQYEGFGYVGSGVLVLSLLSVAVIWGHRWSVRGGIRRWGGLGLCCFLLAIFALSSTVTIAGKPILDLGILYQPLMKVVAPFRSSGRFIWPLHYLVITGALAGWIGQERRSPRLVTLILAATVVIQLADFNVRFLQWSSEYHRAEQQRVFRMDGWQQAKGVYAHMVLFPPQLYGGRGQCTIPEYGPDYYVPLAYQAYKLQVTFNSGYFARIDGQRVQTYCQELNREIQAGEIDEHTIYVVHPSHWHLFKRNAPNTVCGQVSTYIVCLSAQQHTAFREFLLSHEVFSPPLTLGLNQPSFGQGDMVILTAILLPDPSPQPVDCYVMLRKPDGAMAFLQADGRLTMESRPVLSDVMLTPLSREVFHHIVVDGDPGGTYRWIGALTKSGTSTIIGGMVEVSFTVGP